MSSPFIIIDEIESAISAVETKIDTVDGIVDTINSNVNTIKTATAASTSASASGTLSQKLSWIGNTLIGATNNTGGTTTAGTVMAKLNAILNKINTGVTASVQGRSLIVKSGRFDASTTGGYTTVVNVTGSGFFCYAGSTGALHSQNNGVWKDIKVTIDGVVKYWFCSSFGVSSNVNPKIAIAVNDYFMSYGSTPYLLGSDIQIYGTINMNTNGSNKVTHGGDISHIISDLVPFNSSLKIEIGTQSNNYPQPWAVGYILK